MKLSLRSSIRLQVPAVAVLLFLAAFLPISSPFAVPNYFPPPHLSSSSSPTPPTTPTTPKEFVRDVIVPWFNRTRTYFKYYHNRYEGVERFDFTPGLCGDIAATRYEQEIGIPKEFFRLWLEKMLHIDREDEYGFPGTNYMKEFDEIEHNWGNRNETICIPIEGGDFDWLETYTQLVSERIRDTKMEIMQYIDSLDTTDRPLILDNISPAELFNSHKHDKTFQISLVVRSKSRFQKLCPVYSYIVWRVVGLVRSIIGYTS